MKKLGYDRDNICIDETDDEQFNPFIEMKMIDEDELEKCTIYVDIDELETYFIERYKTSGYLPIGYTELEHQYSKVNSKILENCWFTKLVVKKM